MTKWARDDSRWEENFRLPYPLIRELEEELLPDISPHPSSFRKDTIKPFKCLCIALMTLASCAEHRIIGELFGVSAKSVQRCTMKVCKALVKRRKDYIYLPDVEEARCIALRIEQATGYPQTFAAIDGTHVAITPPEDGHKDFVNRKYYASYNCQAICDDRLIFRDVCVKHPGSNHDACVFRNSSLFTKLDTLPTHERMMNGTPIPLHIVADPAYPMLPNVIKSYAGKSSTLEPKIQSFNVYHAAARNCIEVAFGRLKSRWRRILKRMDMDVTSAPLYIVACFVLHNIVERSTICHYSDTWNFNTDPDLQRYLLPQPPTLDEDDIASGVGNRDAIMEWLSTNRALLQSTW